MVALDAAMTQQAAPILSFPTDRRRADIREAASEIMRLSSKDALAWWKWRANVMAEELRAAGVDEAQVTAQVQLFQTAVFFEMAELSQVYS